MEDRLEKYIELSCSAYNKGSVWVARASRVKQAPDDRLQAPSQPTNRTCEQMPNDTHTHQQPPRGALSQPHSQA